MVWKSEVDETKGRQTLQLTPRNSALKTTRRLAGTTSWHTRTQSSNEDKAYANMEEPEQTKPFIAFCFSTPTNAASHFHAVFNQWVSLNPSAHGTGTLHPHTHSSPCLLPQVFLATLWIKIGDPHIPVKPAWLCRPRQHNHFSTYDSAARVDAELLLVKNAESGDHKRPSRLNQHSLDLGCGRLSSQTTRWWLISRKSIKLKRLFSLCGSFVIA